MLGETVTVVRAGTTTDPYSGESMLDWSTVTETDVTTLVPVEPRPSGEPVQDARNAVTSGFTLYLPLGTDITSADRVRVRSHLYRVMGEPAEWAGAGLVVQTERTEG